MAGVELGDQEAEDSFSLWRMCQGEDVRRAAPVVQHSAGGMFAIRDGRWKLIAGNGSGGRQAPRGKPFARPFQLYDLAADPGETTNLIDKHPDRANQLNQQLQQLRDNGRIGPRNVSRRR